MFEQLNLYHIKSWMRALVLPYGMGVASDFNMHGI